MKTMFAVVVVVWILVLEAFASTTARAQASDESLKLRTEVALQIRERFASQFEIGYSENIKKALEEKVLRYDESGYFTCDSHMTIRSLVFAKAVQFKMDLKGLKYAVYYNGDSVPADGFIDEYGNLVLTYNDEKRNISLFGFELAKTVRITREENPQAGVRKVNVRFELTD